MIDRAAIEGELHDIARFARLASYVNANMRYDESAVGRLDAMLTMLANEVLAMERRVMDLLHPPKD